MRCHRPIYLDAAPDAIAVCRNLPIAHVCQNLFKELDRIVLPSVRVRLPDMSTPLR